jgi:hypothetical protein
VTYRTKATVLAVINAALVTVFILGVVFNPERVVLRSALYSWLDVKQTDSVERITVNNENEITLIRKGGGWTVLYDGNEYPARQFRVNDFIDILTKRAAYPVYSTSETSHERLSLTDDTSSRVTVTGTERPLLDLHIGLQDVTGKNIFLRKEGQNEVRSGADIFSGYVYQNPLFWCNLRLIPETETGKLDLTSVMRLTVTPPAGEDGQVRPRIFTREGRAWDSNLNMRLDMDKTDSYVRDVLNTSGDGFAEDRAATDPDLNDCGILLEFEDGATKTVRFGPEDNGKRYAAVSGSTLVYSVPSYAILRLFPDISTFSGDL